MDWQKDSTRENGLIMFLETKNDLLKSNITFVKINNNEIEVGDIYI